MSSRPELLVLAADLDAHVRRLDREVTSIEELGQDPAPDSRCLWAIAGHLQAYYTGCEAVLVRALDRLDGMTPTGPDSHVRILQAAVLDVPGVRPPIIRSETAASLHPYRSFRHFFRHAYGVDLDWDQMKDKVRTARIVLQRFEADVRDFSAFLRAAAG